MPWITMINDSVKCPYFVGLFRRDKDGSLKSEIRKNKKRDIKTDNAQ